MQSTCLCLPSAEPSSKSRVPNAAFMCTNHCRKQLHVILLTPLHCNNARRKKQTKTNCLAICWRFQFFCIFPPFSSCGCDSRWPDEVTDRQMDTDGLGFGLRVRRRPMRLIRIGSVETKAPSSFVRRGLCLLPGSWCWPNKCLASLLRVLCSSRLLLFSVCSSFCFHSVTECLSPFPAASSSASVPSPPAYCILHLFT